MNFYQTPEVLDKTVHAALRYHPQSSYGFAAALTTVPLVADEIARAAQFYPVLFAPGDTAQAVAVLGLGDRNVYLDAHQHWTAPYIPAFVRRYPFVLAQNPDGNGSAEQLFLAFDRAAPHFSMAGDGQALIDAHGELATVGLNALNFLRAVYQGSQRTQTALAALQTSGVLVDKVLTIQDSTTQRLIGGFRSVDAEKFRALPDETLAQWTRQGLVALIQYHWDSLQHLNAVAQASVRPVQSM